MQAVWKDTFNAGRVLYFQGENWEIAHLPGYEKAEAISVWEGIAGCAPSGRIAHWKWQRGLKKFHKELARLAN